MLNFEVQIAIMAVLDVQHILTSEYLQVHHFLFNLRMSLFLVYLMSLQLSSGKYHTLHTHLRPIASNTERRERKTCLQVHQ